jgi:hypothetical protein
MPKTVDHITFEEASHTYKNNNTGGLYKSVTGLLKEYTPVFDSINIAKRVAQKTGRDYQEILDEWEANKQHACTKGTFVHKVIEDYYNDGLVSEGFENVLDKVEAIVPRNLGGKSEALVYNDACQTAGQIDYNYISDNLIYIVDWKTNKEIKYEGYGGQKMLGPLSHLEDCNYTHYCLQLSIYALLLSRMLGLGVGDLYLVHILGEEVKKIPCDFLEDEARLILNNRYKSLTKL